MDAHGTGLLSTVVISLVVAFLGGAAARALRLPPLVGYLLAGVAVGPFTPGFVADQRIASELAEIGVALLLFGIGLHFSIADLLAVRRIILPGALLQVAATTGIGVVVARFVVGLPPSGSLILGLSLAIASTAVATRALEDRGRLDAPPGRIALGWLVVQDIVVVLALVMVPVAGRANVSASELFVALGQVLLQITGFVAAVLLVGRRAIPWLLGKVAQAGSRELFTLAVIVIALGVAYGSATLFGVSLALGAFFAGVVLGESDLSHSAAAEALPIQQVFTVLFFVSVGMLFDPMSLVKLPLEIAAVLLAIVIGTGLTTLLILLALRVPAETAGTVGAAFAQIGEFSFILSGIAVGHGLLDPAGRNLILAAALLAILINPFLFPVAARVSERLAGSFLLAGWRGRADEFSVPAPVDLSDHAILVGHGRVGQTVATALQHHGLSYVVIEADRKLAESLRAQGMHVIYGDATREEVLAAASPEAARLIVVALPDAFTARRVISIARKLHSGIETVVRTHSDEEAIFLADEAQVGLAVMGEREIAIGISDFALQRLGVSAAHAQATMDRLRARDDDEPSHSM
jgi:CPA2 family monovalent cation:H+ antiporter-2